jgi:hypothetical protein
VQHVRLDHGAQRVVLQVRQLRHDIRLRLTEAQGLWAKGCLRIEGGSSFWNPPFVFPPLYAEDKSTKWTV